jgi:hypothetical protein
MQQPLVYRRNVVVAVLLDVVDPTVPALNQRLLHLIGS